MRSSFVQRGREHDQPVPPLESLSIIRNETSVRLSRSTLPELLPRSSHSREAIKLNIYFRTCESLLARLHRCFGAALEKEMSVRHGA